MVNVFPSFPTARGPYGASLRSAGPNDADRVRQVSLRRHL
jgi:hypothetical protein